MTSAARDIQVYWAHALPPGTPPRLMGTLSVQTIRNKECFSFAFCEQWLKERPPLALDPDLQHYGGRQYATKDNFGLFLDSAPDRWGRKLMQRREALRARKAGEPASPLQESDYLLGVYDETRMGALRFRCSPDGPFLNNDTALAAPPWTRLQELEEACRHLEADSPTDEHGKWLSMLLAPGSSLGGARPKASVTSPDGDLWMAKFPSRNDDVSVAAWEYATALMARDAGLHIPEVRLLHLSKRGATFLSRRFDRHGDIRLHFSSAMTLLGKRDGDNAENGSSYLELAEFILSHDAAPEADLAELWKRIAFSIAVSNTDDHLRNHGFLLQEDGWRLSPMYDVNPNPEGVGLSLNVTEDDNSLDFDLPLQVAPYFRISLRDAKGLLDDLRRVTRSWRNYAEHCGLKRDEQDLMSTAFRA